MSRNINWQNKLKISVDPLYEIVDDENWMMNRKCNLYTKTGLLVATDYLRVIVCSGNPYVEFRYNNLKWENFYTPQDQLYRRTDKKVYYEEYRSKDESSILLRWQLKTSFRSNYRVAKGYISPFDLYLSDNTPVVIDNN